MCLCRRPLLGGDDGPIGNQGDAVVKGAAVLERSLNPDVGAADLDYLQELIAIQAGGCGPTAY